MTAEEIKKEIELLQNVANNIKVSVGCLRSDINQLSGAIKQDNDEFEARLAEAESRGFQKGYEKGFAEGRKWGADDNEIRKGDEVAAFFGESEQFACVLYENPDRTECLVLRNDGVVSWWTKAAIRKTGRHFTEVEKLLEAMK